MVEAGAIDAAAADAREAARRSQLTNAIEMKETFGLYFKEQVRRELVERFGGQRVAEGGLQGLHHARHRRCSRPRRRSSRTALPAIEKRPRLPARAARDRAKALRTTCRARWSRSIPQTGAVRAMVGGRDFDDSRFNRATQAQRQSRLRVQAVRLRRGARGGLLAGVA